MHLTQIHIRCFLKLAVLFSNYIVNAVEEKWLSLANHRLEILRSLHWHFSNKNVPSSGEIPSFEENFLLQNSQNYHSYHFFLQVQISLRFTTRFSEDNRSLTEFLTGCSSLESWAEDSRYITLRATGVIITQEIGAEWQITIIIKLNKINVY